MIQQSDLDRLDLVDVCVHLRTGQLTKEEVSGLIELVRCARSAREIWREHVHLGHPDTAYWVPVLLRGIGINP